MNDLIGKMVEMHVDGFGKITAKLTEIREETAIVLSKGSEFRIPMSKISIHREVPENKTPEPNIYMCKNDTAGCKGMKVLSVGDVELKDMRCGCTMKEREAMACDFGKVGVLFQLPMEIQCAFLEGMSTEVPVIKKAKEKK